MIEIALKLVPIFFFFLVGVTLRRTGIARKEDGDFMLRLVFFVCLPLLILLTLAPMELSPDKAMLPLANIVVNTGCVLAMFWVARFMRLPRETLGSMAMNTMIANNAFMFPFILAFYGESGFADAVLFDFGNAIMVATVTYAMAFRFSSEVYDRTVMLRRIGFSPIFWALAMGIVLSVSGIGLAPSVGAVIEPLAQMTAPLILIALGVFFSLSLKRIRLIALALLIRMGLGLLIGIGFASLIGLEGQTFVVVALCSGAPIGFMALAFSSMARLDMELTANAVSLSILAGLVYTPLLIILFGGTG